MENWITATERSIHDTLNTEVPFDQYKLIVNRFQVCYESFKYTGETVLRENMLVI